MRVAKLFCVETLKNAGEAERSDTAVIVDSSRLSGPNCRVVGFTDVSFSKCVPRT